MSSQATAGASRKVVIERTYRARVEELWELWTTRSGFESWWGPEGFRVEVRTLEARTGGTLHYDMIADTPEMVAAMQQMGQAVSHECRCRYSVYEPFSRLTITSLIDFIPGVPVYESTIVAEFHPAGEHVRMVVTLSPMHDDHWTRMATMGFTSQLSKLDRRFGTEAS